MSGEQLFDGHDIAVGAVPSDLDSGQHPTHGFWVDADGYKGVAVLFIKNAGIAGNNPNLRIQQATDADGSHAKHLNFAKVLRKTSTTSSIRGRWEVIDVGSTNHYMYDGWGEQNTIVGVYIETRDMDTAHGFNHLRATIFDPGDVPFQSPNYRGAWSGSTAYAVGDMVNVTTTLWYAVTANTNSHPAANNANWDEFTGTPPGQYGTILYIGDQAQYIGRDVPIL